MVATSVYELFKVIKWIVEELSGSQKNHHNATQQKNWFCNSGTILQIKAQSTKIVVQLYGLQNATKNLKELSMDRHDIKMILRLSIFGQSTQSVVVIGQLFM